MIKIFKALPLVVALICGLAVGAAQATTHSTDLGTVSTTASSVTFDHASLILPISFVDTLSFSVTGPSVLTGTFTDLHDTLLGQSKFLGLYFFDTKNVAAKLDGGTGAINLVQSGSKNESFTFTASLPSAGTYDLAISGKTAGWFGASYKVALSATSVTASGAGSVAAPVPEPESYAMLLAGLGLMGTIARRRRKTETV